MTTFNGQDIANALIALDDFKTNLHNALFDKGMTSVGNTEGLPLAQWANLIRGHYIAPPTPEPPPAALADTSFAPESPPPEPSLPDFSGFDPPPEGQRWGTVWVGATYLDGRLALTLADLYAAYEESASTPQQHNQLVRFENLTVHANWYPTAIDATGPFIRRTTAETGTGQDRYLYQRMITLLPVESA